MRPFRNSYASEQDVPNGKMEVLVMAKVDDNFVREIAVLTQWSIEDIRRLPDLSRSSGDGYGYEIV